MAYKNCNFDLTTVLLSSMSQPDQAICRKEVCTSDLENSIWRDIPEDTFRQHLVALEERTNAVPLDPQLFALEEWLKASPYASRTEYSLPLATEQQLADDFACLVAVEEGAQSVAAVCVEEWVEPAGMLLRFAALDVEMGESVRNALGEVSEILARAAKDSSKGVSECESLVDDLFHIVVQLHHRRLLARLRSVRWKKPKHLQKSHKKPLWQDFANLMHRAQFYYVKEKASRLLVERSIVDLAAVYEAFETSPPTSIEEVVTLKQLVNDSFVFCSNNLIQDYVQRIYSTEGAVPTKQVGSAIKCLRQIQKIAAYRRVCISLVGTAQVHPKLLIDGVQIAYLTPYKSIPTSIGYEEWAKTCHVHAEVQLAVHYDVVGSLEQDQASMLPPRTIGISKWLCYLCYQFLRAHKKFFPSKTHGRLYDQWTIPDLADFNQTTLASYRSIVQAIDNEVVQQTQSEPELWRVEPMTSIEHHFSGKDG